MATTYKSPKLDRQIKALVAHMSIEQAEAVAATPTRAGEPKSFADELTEAIRAEAQARLAQAKAGPLPDEPNFNEETLEAFRELESGGGTRYESVDDFFAAHGI